MSLLQSYRNLSPRTRIGVGLGLLAWGAVGLHLSDRTEERYGFTPTEEDKAALARALPSITAVDRDDVNFNPNPNPNADNASPSSSSSSGNSGNWR